MEYKTRYKTNLVLPRKIIWLWSAMKYDQTQKETFGSYTITFAAELIGCLVKFALNFGEFGKLVGNAHRPEFLLEVGHLSLERRLNLAVPNKDTHKLTSKKISSMMIHH